MVQKCNVLLVGAECMPFVKTGGLADVLGTLPACLQELGAQVRVILPFHRKIKDQYDSEAKVIAEFQVSLGWRNQYVGIRELEKDGVIYYFVDNEYYFGGPVYKGGEAEGEQYAFFSRAVLEALDRIDFQPDVLHCNDWHTAPIPMLIKTQYQDRPQGGMKTLFTIHNIMYQGQYSFEMVQDLLGLPEWLNTAEYMEAHGCANFMKAGLVFADKINTVSPTYAQELQHAHFAYGLEGILQARQGDMLGILNGIDTKEFDPTNDPLIRYPYTATRLAAKRKNKEALMKRLGLTVSVETPLIGMVTRLTSQKGVELVLRVFHEMLAEDCAFVLLGTGDADYEHCFRALEQQYPGRVCSYIGYDNTLAHQIYAGADLFLMPSKFEPCGISQMLALRYGTLPIVRETGGLRDTVVPYNAVTGEGNGFSFTNFNAHDMLHVIRYALETIREPKQRRRLIGQAMAVDHSFVRSAEEYLACYHSLIQ